MTESKICTCPSGDGSLRHPCPEHQTSGGQAGGDERAAVRRLSEEAESTVIGMVEYCLNARVCLGMDEGFKSFDPEEEHDFVKELREFVEGRAALAQPSPDAPYADDIAADLERSDWTPEDALRWYAAGKHFDTVNGRTRIIDTGAVASNALKHLSLPYLEMKGDAELTELREAMAQPSPAQAEAERPEVVAYRTIGRHEKHQHPHYALNYYKQNAEDQAAHWRERGCEVSEDELMTVAQHDRIFGALRAKAVQLREALEWRKENQAGQRELLRSVTAERDAALARVAELAQALRHLLHNIKASGKRIDLGLAKECAEDALARIDSTVAAQAQHSGPEEFSFEYRHPNGESHTVTVSRDQVINEMPDFLFEALCSKFCNCEPAGETNVVECCCDEYAEEFKLLAAAPGNSAQHSVPGKYDDVLLPFLKSMEHELHANTGKGDRPGWLQMDRKTALLEIYYHLGKLQKATKGNDTAGIVEYAADVANMSMMLVDVCGLLAAAPGKEGV